MKKLLKISCIVLFLSSGLLLISHFLLEHNAPNTVSQVMNHYGWIFTVWRYLMYADLLWLWPSLIKVIGVRQNWEAEIIHYFSHQRFKLFILFALIELLFVYNIVGHLWLWL